MSRGKATRLRRAKSAHGSVEPLEGRRLLAAAGPTGQPDLAVASDSGALATDDLTNLDNGSAGKVLQFIVPGTEPGALVTLWSDGRLIGRAIAPATATTVATNGLVKLADGPHAVTARQTLPGEADSPDSAPLTITVDTAAPPAPEVPDLQDASDSGAFRLDDVTNDNTPTFDVTGAAPYLRLYRNGTRVSGPYETGPSLNGPFQADGTASYAATAVDAAGNESATGPALPVVVDTAAPAPPAGSAPDLADADDSGASASDNLTNVVAPRFTIRPVSDAPYFQFYRDGVRLSGAYAFGGTFAAPAQADGPADYTVRYVDAAGNVSAATPVQRVTVDTVAPDAPGAPDLTAPSDRGIRNDDNLTNDDTPTLSVAAVSGAPYLRVYRDGQLVSTGFPSAPTYTVPHLADGTYAFTAAAVDAAGNASAAGPGLTIVIDTVAPGPPAPAGTPDATFGPGGNPTDSLLTAWGVVVQPDGKVISAGSTNLDRTVRVRRHTADGKIDTTFGNGGEWAGPAADNAGQLLLQPDGRILVLCASKVVRLTAGGLPDPTFGTDGTGTVSLPFGMREFALAPDGKVVLAGSISSDQGVVRLTADGRPDPSFGTAGTGVAPFPTSFFVQAVRVAPDGKVILAGQRGSTAAAVIRYDADGTPDAGFGSGGVFSDAVRPVEEGHDVVLEPDGGMVLTGRASDPGGSEATNAMALRVRPDGALDASFGGGGRVFVPGFPAFFVVAGRLSDGRIVIASDGDGNRLGLIRLTPGGQLDPTFGTGGVARPRAAVGPDRLAVDAEDNVLVASRTGLYRFRGTTAGIPDLQAASDCGVSDTDNITNDATPTFDLAARPGTYFRLYRGATRVSGDYESGGGTYTTPGTQPDGTFDYAASLVDTAGNESAKGPVLTVTIDTVAPAGGARAGSLDPTFDGDGRRLSTGEGGPTRTVFLPDGRILGVGYGSAANSVQFLRYRPDGSLDPTFGTGGRVVLKDFMFYIGGLALLPDGKFLLAGGVSGGGQGMLSRFNADGTLDRTFAVAGANGGVAYLPLPAEGVAVAPDGRIVLIGNGEGPRGYRDVGTVMRYTPAGYTDPTFGTAGNGTVTLPRVNFIDYTEAFTARQVVVQADGRIVVAGTTLEGDIGRAAVVRLAPSDGAIDPTFGDGGVAGPGLTVLRLQKKPAGLGSINPDPGGGFLVAGTFDGADFGTVRSTFVAHLTADGRPDANFGTAGQVTLPGLVGWAAHRLSTGQVLVTAGSPQGQILTLARLNPDGQLDPTFGDGGASSVRFDAPDSPPPTPYPFTDVYESVLGPDDRLLVVASVNFKGGLLRLFGTDEGIPDLQDTSDSGASATDNVTRFRNLGFDIPPALGAAGPGAAPYLRLYRGETLVSGLYQPAGGAYATGAQPDGTWTYSASFVDAAGNESARGPALSVTVDTVAPTVGGVFAAGTAWTAEFLAALAARGLGDAGGYAVPAAEAAGGGTAPLPWVGLDLFRLQLNEPVTVGDPAAAAQIAGVARATYTPVAAAYDPVTRRLSWQLAGPVGAERLSIILSAGAVQDVAGNPLADGSFRVNVLPGDVDRSGSVDASDLILVRNAMGSGPTAPKYRPFFDVDGDALVNTSDLVRVRNARGTRLPTPVAPAARAAPGPFAERRIVPLRRDDHLVASLV